MIFLNRPKMTFFYIFFLNSDFDFILFVCQHIKVISSLSTGQAS